MCSPPSGCPRVSPWFKCRDCVFLWVEGRIFPLDFPLLFLWYQPHAVSPGLWPARPHTSNFVSFPGLPSAQGRPIPLQGPRASTPGGFLWSPRCPLTLWGAGFPQGSAARVVRSAHPHPAPHPLPAADPHLRCIKLCTPLQPSGQGFLTNSSHGLRFPLGFPAAQPGALSSGFPFDRSALKPNFSRSVAH